MFTVGLGVPADIERDDRDGGAVHVVAELAGTVVGTGRLVAGNGAEAGVGTVGRMAVVAGGRGRGAGAAMLAALESAAIVAGLTSVTLHAQLPARRFYQRAGYTAVGPVYLEAGLEHVTMTKQLATLRPVADSDSDALIELISTCWAAYPGCVMDVDGEEPWLRSPATAYRSWGATMWVLVDQGRLIACVGLKPGGRSAELKSLYVAPAARRRGLGAALSDLVETEARRRGYDALDLWSDTRFTDAHRLYEGLGYRRSPVTRELHDRSQTSEFHFQRPL